MENLLSRTLAWAQKESPIKVVIQLGSHMTGMSDAYSDYDLALFCSSFEDFFNDEKWLSELGKIWVCVHETTRWGNKTYPVLLIILEGVEKLDLTFYDRDVLQEILNSPTPPGEYNRGYKVLLDKDSLTTSMPLPSYKENPAGKPSQQEFERVIKEFWFEVHHVAKYLKREDLWAVKFRMGLINDHFLLKMIEWNEEAKRNWESLVPPLGKRMRSWVGPATWEALYKVFAHFDSQDSWKALMHTIELFRTLARDTAQRLGYSSLDDLDAHMSWYIKTLREPNKSG
jgi:aminoglycoside 6-adenylyltransferase